MKKEVYFYMLDNQGNDTITELFYFRYSIHIIFFFSENYKMKWEKKINFPYS